MGWFFERPQVPFEVPWSSVGEFWERATAALALVPHLEGGNGFEPACLLTKVRGTLTRTEEEFLRTYNQQMVQAGSGYHITVAHQHGVLSHHLIPFFILLEDLYRPPTTMPAIYPWIDFPARYEELTGRRYDLPDHAFIRR